MQTRPNAFNRFSLSRLPCSLPFCPKNKKNRRPNPDADLFHFPLFFWLLFTVFLPFQSNFTAIFYQFFTAFFPLFALFVLLIQSTKKSPNPASILTSTNLYLIYLITLLVLGGILLKRIFLSNPKILIRCFLVIQKSQWITPNNISKNLKRHFDESRILRWNYKKIARWSSACYFYFLFTRKILL